MAGVRWGVLVLSAGAMGGRAVAPGGAAQGSSQAYLGPRAGAFARSRPGDMMIDWVSPRLRGDAAAHSVQAVRVPCAAGRVAG